MSLRFIYGRSGTGKTTFCSQEIGKLIKENNKIWMITPEQFSFTAEQNLMKAAGTDAVIHAEVLTFERMAHRVIAEVGNSLQTNLSECGKAMLLYNILDENKENLQYLGKTEKNLDIISRMITELKKHNIKNEELNKALETIQDKRLEFKIKDISLLFHKFNEAISNHYIDEDDLLTILSENIEKVDMFQNSVIYIDEFAGFTKQEYLVIEKLLKLAKRVNISICTDNLRENTNPDIDLFYPNKVCANKIIELAKKNNIAIEKDIILTKKYRFQNEELYELEEELYHEKKERYTKECKDIKLFLANNPYSEIEYVANHIIELVRDSHYQYKDIAIITKDITGYASLVKAIFSEYEIPVFIDEKQDLSQNSFIKYIIAFLDIFAKNWSIRSNV